MGFVWAEEIMNSQGRKHGFLLCDVECAPILLDKDQKMQLAFNLRWQELLGGLSFGPGRTQAATFINKVWKKHLSMLTWEEDLF